MSIIEAKLKSDKSRESNKSTVQTYARYKDSGVEWLGEIPEHWEAKKIKFLADIYNGDSLNETLKKKYSSDNLMDLAYISSKDINVNDSSITYENGLRIPKEKLKLKTASKNSSLLCIEGGSAGRKIAFTNQEVCFVNKLACFDIRNEGNSKFLFFSLKGRTFQTQFNLSMSGLIGGVAISAINNFILPIPPLPEQTAIANFLDDKTQKIDQAIDIKEQQIALLKERKQILIHKAVTGQLIMENGKWIMTPKEKMKDSGVEWIGEIPEHWEVKALKFICNLQSGEFISSEDFKEEGFPVYGGNGFRAYAESYTNEGFYALIGRQGALCGNVNYAKGKFYATEHAVVAYPINNEDTFWLGETIKVANFNRLSQSAAQPGIAVGVIKNERFPYPPLSEQKEISEYIETASQKINTAISLKRQEIEKLKEYKSSLINSVVTGKVKIIEN